MTAHSERELRHLWQRVTSAARGLPRLIFSVTAWAISAPYRVLSQDRAAWQPPSLEEQMHQALQDVDDSINRARAAQSTGASPAL